MICGRLMVWVSKKICRDIIFCCIFIESFGESKQGAGTSVMPQFVWYCIFQLSFLSAFHGWKMKVQRSNLYNRGLSSELRMPSGCIASDTCRKRNSLHTIRVTKRNTHFFLNNWGFKFVQFLMLNTFSARNKKYCNVIAHSHAFF